MIADVDAHVTALRHMAAEDLHLPSVADFIEALAAERDAAVQRAEAEWNKAIEAAEAKAILDSPLAAGRIRTLRRDAGEKT